jgi:hypothetical protein
MKTIARNNPNCTGGKTKNQRYKYRVSQSKSSLAVLGKNSKPVKKNKIIKIHKKTQSRKDIIKTTN